MTTVVRQPDAGRPTAADFAIHGVAPGKRLVQAILRVVHETRVREPLPKHVLTLRSCHEATDHDAENRRPAASGSGGSKIILFSSRARHGALYHDGSLLEANGGDVDWFADGDIERSERHGIDLSVPARGTNSRVRVEPQGD